MIVAQLLAVASAALVPTRLVLAPHCEVKHATPSAHSSRHAALTLSAETTTVAVPLSSPTAAESAKDELLSLLIDGLASVAEERPLVSELLLTLERLNPTPEPARSVLLNGVWELKFAGAPGPGLIDSPTREIALALYATGYSAGAAVQLLSKLPGQPASVSGANPPNPSYPAPPRTPPAPPPTPPP